MMVAPLGNKNNLTWQPEHDAALKKHRKAECSAAKAAIEINREFRTTYTRNSVIGRMHRLGLGVPRIVTRILKAAMPKPQKQTRPRFVAPKLEPVDIVLRAAEVMPRHVALIELGPDDCRYPYGDGPFTFCGQPKGEHSYCAAHQNLSRRA